MRVGNQNGIPIIEGTPTELVKLATAITGAISAREAVVFDHGIPVMGIKLVEE